MTIRRSLLAVTTMALLLTACAGTDDTTDTPASTTEQPDDDSGDDVTGGETTDDTDDTATDDEPAGDDSGAGSDPVTVALTFDGQRVPIATACNGVDGAVLATTEGEVTISLVREEGLALRYQAEGFTAETDQVQTEEFGATTVYAATLSSDDVPAVDVEFEIGDTSVLDDC